jgi:hypothetical protein
MVGTIKDQEIFLEKIKGVLSFKILMKIPYVMCFTVSFCRGRHVRLVRSIRPAG